MEYICNNKKCGLKSKPVEINGKSLGELSKQSGFLPMMTTGCGTFWLCPKCYSEAKEYALKMYGILCEEHPYISKETFRR